MDANNSGYLIKSAQTPWTENCMLCVDAGTLAAGIHDILRNQLLLDQAQNKRNYRGSDSREIRAHGGATGYYKNLFATSAPHIQVQHRPTGRQASAKNQKSTQRTFPSDALPFTRPWNNTWHIVNNLIASILITHPHLDHIAGLVINSGNFNIFKPKGLAGLHYTVDSLHAHIFNGVVWPNLTNEGSDAVGFLKLCRMSRARPQGLSTDAWVEKYTKEGLAQNLNVLPFAVSHGTASQLEGRRSSSVISSNGGPGRTPTSLEQQQHQQPPSHSPPPAASQTEESGTYLSTAFFVSDSLTGKSLLIWGDVEPDIVSKRPRNLPVWTHAAHLYSTGSLQAVFIECSYANPHEDSLLFGHFTPTHLFRELNTLRAMCTPPTLKGLSFVIMHVKNEDPLLLIPPAAATTATAATASGVRTKEEEEKEVEDEEDYNVAAEAAEAATGLLDDETNHSSDSPADSIKEELDKLAKANGFECTFYIAIAGHSYTF